MTGANETWTAETVLAASDAWSWEPDEAHVHRTDELVVVAYPDYVGTPTVARSLGSDRDPAELVDEAHAVARDLGRDTVWWNVSDLRRPHGLERELRRRGGEVVHRMDVLALPIDGGVPDLVVPPDVTVCRVTDEQSLREALVVSQTAFDDPPVTDQLVADMLVEVERGIATSSGARFVAYVDGRPASTGGFTLAGAVARLWGGSTHPDLRGRGGYRATLAERLRLAAGIGATLALTHGRVESSSPILQRLGFTRYGETRQLVVEL